MTEKQAYAWGFHHAMSQTPMSAHITHRAYFEGYEAGLAEFAREYAEHAAHEHQPF